MEYTKQIMIDVLKNSYKDRLTNEKIRKDREARKTTVLTNQTIEDKNKKICLIHLHVINRLLIELIGNCTDCKKARNQAGNKCFVRNNDEPLG